MTKRHIRHTPGLGEEMLCTRCEEWWPNDSEFYYLAHGQTRNPCKACYATLPSVIARDARRRKGPSNPQPARIHA